VIPLESHVARPKRRNHYVPQFLLSRFVSATGRLWQLDKKSGCPKQCSPKNAAVIHDYYRVNPRTFEGGLPETPEDLLEKTETPAAKIIADMTSTHLEPNGRCRDLLALFFANLDVRGPSGRGQTESIVRAALQERVIALLESPEPYREWKAQYGPIDEGSIEQERLAMLESARRGEDVTLSKDNYVAIVLAQGSQLSPVVADLGWKLLVAESDDELILSDTPVAHWDPAAPSFTAAAWRSSPEAQATIPLDPQHCMCISASFSDWNVHQVDRRVIEEVNLRSYAWADNCIYGQSQKTLQDVHRMAKHNPHRLLGMNRSGSVVVIERNHPARGDSIRVHPTRRRQREQ